LENSSPIDKYNFRKLNFNCQDSSVPKPLSQKFARKQGFLCPGLLPIPAFGQTLTALIIINSNSSATLHISHIQWAQVSIA